MMAVHLNTNWAQLRTISLIKINAIQLGKAATISYGISQSKLYDIQV